MVRIVKILIVAPFGSPQRDEAIAKGFVECGAEVYECRYGDVIYAPSIFTRTQLRFAFGPVLQKLSERVCQAVEAFKPDVVFFRRPLEFTPAMLRQIKSRSDALLCSFNNDDPFSKSYTDRRWRNLRNAIKEFDVTFAFRRSNLIQYDRYGSRLSELWEPFYSPWLHRPLVDRGQNYEQKRRFLFAMHAEPDLRRDAVVSLTRSGIPIDVYSWNWDKVFGKKDAIAMKVAPPIWGDEYVRAIGSALGTLCFFSRQNNDELTSRVFEIPASGGLLIAERNDRIMQLFRDGEDAVLFSEIEELVSKCRALIDNPELAERIRKQGQRRITSSHNSVIDRCSSALNIFKRIREAPMVIN